MAFQSENFVFDNISNKDMGVILVDINGSSVLKDYGIPYEVSLEVDQSINSLQPTVYGTTPTINPIELQLCLINKVGEPMAWTTDDVIRVSRWINQIDFKPFQSEDRPDIIQYLKCTGIKKSLNHLLQGVYTFTMQADSPTAYTPILNKMVVINDTAPKTVNIENTTNVLDKYYPEIKLICNDEKGEMQIRNRTTGEDFIIVGLEFGEEITIDGFMKSVKSSTGKVRVMNTNRNWFWLKQGENIIECSGKGEFNIKCQFPIAV